MKRSTGRRVVRLALEGRLATREDSIAWLGSIARRSSRRVPGAGLRRARGRPRRGSRDVLRAALDRGERVTKFLIADPSIEEIFIERVGRPPAEEKHLAGQPRPPTIRARALPRESQRDRASTDRTGAAIAEPRRSRTSWPSRAASASRAPHPRVPLHHRDPRARRRRAGPGADASSASSTAAARATGSRWSRRGRPRGRRRRRARGDPQRAGRRRAAMPDRRSSGRPPRLAVVAAPRRDVAAAREHVVDGSSTAALVLARDADGDLRFDLYSNDGAALAPQPAHPPGRDSITIQDRLPAPASRRSTRRRSSTRPSSTSLPADPTTRVTDPDRRCRRVPPGSACRSRSSWRSSCTARGSPTAWRRRRARRVMEIVLGGGDALPAAGREGDRDRRAGAAAVRDRGDADDRGRGLPGPDLRAHPRRRRPGVRRPRRAGLSIGLVATFGVMLVLGFAVYASLYAGAASLVSRQEDINQIVAPLTLHLGRRLPRRDLRRHGRHPDSTRRWSSSCRSCRCSART